MPSVRTTKARPTPTTTIITTTVQPSTATSTQPDTTAFSTDYTTTDSDELETSSTAFTTSPTTTTSRSSVTTSKSISTSKLPHDGRLYCSAQTARDVQWPDTEAGLTAAMACPNNYNGKQKIMSWRFHLLQCQVKISDFLLVWYFICCIVIKAVWICGVDGQWVDKPNLRQCTSAGTESITSKVKLAIQFSY